MFQARFLDNLKNAREKERLYLLQAFSSMAISRSEKYEAEFIKRAALNIFNAGFTFDLSSDEAKEEDDSLKREARDQLINVCVKHPFVMSMLLELFEDDAMLEKCKEVAILIENE